MAKFVAISGPASSGKTEIFEALKDQIGSSGIVFVPDIFQTVWQELVDNGLFYETEDINKDAELLCCFIQRISDRYKENINKYKDSNKLVIMDSCWIDIAIYSQINMWYTHILKEVQESLLANITVYDKNLSRIYITQNDELKNTVAKYRNRFKRYNVKFNRPLEIRHYELYSNMRNAVYLPTSESEDIIKPNEDIVNYIIEDLQELGYL